MPIKLSPFSVQVMLTGTARSLGPLPTPDALLTPISPTPVPVPYPNFSSAPMPMAATSKIILSEAMAHGFSTKGAEDAFLKQRVPAQMPDILTLSRFSQGTMEPPGQTKVIVDLIQQRDQQGEPPSSSSSGSQG